MFLKRVDIRIRRLIDALGAEVLPFHEVEKKMGLPIPDFQRLYCGGFYIAGSGYDFIGINFCVLHTESHLNSTVLHELTHWSGRSTRLARRAIVKTERNVVPNKEEASYEECVAQYGMHYLASALGFDMKEYNVLLTEYLAYYLCENVAEAAEDGRRAAEWLIGVAELSKAA